MSPSDSLLLPAGARLVHIGPHKTGSTAIQVALWEARAELAQYGVSYPGQGARARRAGWALGLMGIRAGVERPPIEVWERYAEQVAAAGPDRVCVSNEDFGRADQPTAGRIVEDLGDESVHVVAVARRLDRFLPSQWQERVKAGDRRSYEDWLRLVLGPETREWNYRNVWSAHDIEALVERWTSFVGPDRFTLIISDDRDRTLIPRTFEQMLGLPDGMLEPHSGRANASLTSDQVELIRAINEEFVRRGWDLEVRRSVVRDTLLRELSLMEPHPARPRSPLLPDWALDRVRELSRSRVDAVADMKVRVIGDPADLLVPDTAVAAEEQGELTIPADVAARAVGAVVAAALDREQQRELERVRQVEALRAKAREARRTAAVAAVQPSGRELLWLAAAKAARRLRGR